MFVPAVLRGSGILREYKRGDKDVFLRRTSNVRPAALRSCGTLPLVGELGRETQVQSGRSVLKRWAEIWITGICI